MIDIVEAAAVCKKERNENLVKLETCGPARCSRALNLSSIMTSIIGAGLKMVHQWSIGHQNEDGLLANVLIYRSIPFTTMPQYMDVVETKKIGYCFPTKESSKPFVPFTEYMYMASKSFNNQETRTLYKAV